MDKTLKFIICLMVVLSFSNIAYAEGTPYLSFNLGVTSANDSDVEFNSGYNTFAEYKTGYAFSGAIGLEINKRIRVETEISYQNNDIGDMGILKVNGGAKILSILVNNYINIVKNQKVTPYLCAGFGMARVSVDDITTSGSGGYMSGDDDTVVAFQVGTGVGIALNEHATLDIMYRFFKTQDINFEIAKSEFSSNNLYLGLRFPF